MEDLVIQRKGFKKAGDYDACEAFGDGKLKKGG